VPIKACDEGIGPGYGGPVSYEGIGPGYGGPLIYEVQDLLRRYGYGINPSGHHDPPTQAVVRAFQRHFRPARIDGRIDQSTIATLERLLAALDGRAPVA
jgi:N-acetylmuramoyl-L-alanine amidase